MAVERLSTAAARFRGYVVLVIGTGLTRGFALLAAVILARHLGPARFGQVSVFLTIIGFWASADFLDSSYVRFAAQGDPALGRAYLRSTMALKLTWNGILVMLAFPLGWTLSRYAFHKPGLLWPVALGVISGVGLNMLSLRAATYQAREQFLRFSATTSCFYVLSLIGVGAVAALSRGRSATPVYATYLTASSLAGGYAWLTLARATRRMHASRRVLRSIISFAKWLFGANVGYMVTQRLDLFLVAGFGSLTAVGEYGAALRVVTTVSLMTGTLAPLLLPRAAKTRGEHDLVRDYLKHASALTGAIGCLLTVLWLAAPIAVRLLFGPGYADAARLARIILVGTFAIALYTPLSQLFMRDDAPRKMLYLSVIRLAVIAGVGAFAVPRIGAAGAAAAVASAEVSVLVYVCFALRHDLVAALRASSAPGAHPQAVPRPAVRVPR